MKMKHLLALPALAALAAIMAVPTAFAQQELRLSTHFTPNDPPGMGVAKLKELIEEKTQGRISVRIWWNSELGKERENVEMVRDGSIEMTTSLAAGVGGWVPETAITEFPYLYKDDAHILRVMKSIRPHLEEILAPHNFQPLGAINVGFRHVLHKKGPILSLDDIKGVKLRVPNPFYSALFDALGARASVLPWADIYIGLQSGVIDAMEASPALIQSMRFHEQAKHLNRTNHIAAVIVYLANKKWFDGLPADLKVAVSTAADEASEYQFQLQAKSEQSSIDTLVAEGVVVHDVKDIGEWRETAVAFRNQYVKEKGAAWEALYQKVLAVD